MAARQHLFYLHGFKSSGQAYKAQLMADFVAPKTWIKYHQPNLANTPAKALAQLEQEIIPLLPHVSLIGSSLGGYYAAFLAQKYDLPAVLINPAAYPDKLLQDLLGPHQNPYTGQTFVLNEQHIAELQAMQVQGFSRPEAIQVLLQSGDEVLDYQHAAQYYKDCQVCIEPGGTHEFTGFERYLEPILTFLQIAEPETL